MKQQKKAIHCYDKAARNYAEALFSELDGKPLDRLLLQKFAETHLDKGLVGDLGCGPGQTTLFLHKAGLTQLLGIDLSPKMIEEARRLCPDTIAFDCANMLALPYPDQHFGGLIAFYAIVHFTADELPILFAEVRRVLQPGGQFFFSFHIGEGALTITDFFEHTVDIDFHQFDPDQVMEMARAEGFEVVEALVRYPYEGKEYASKRAYITLELKTTPV